MKIALLLLASLPLGAADLLTWSQVALVGTSAVDAVSSWRVPEANPLLRGPDGRFSHRGLTIKIGLVTGGIIAQNGLKRHLSPKQRRRAAILNFAVSGAVGFVAARNLRGRRQ